MVCLKETPCKSYFTEWWKRRDGIRIALEHHLFFWRIMCCSVFLSFSVATEEVGTETKNYSFEVKSPISERRFDNLVYEKIANSRELSWSWVRKLDYREYAIQCSDSSQARWTNWICHCKRNLSKPIKPCRTPKAPSRYAWKTMRLIRFTRNFPTNVLCQGCKTKIRRHMNTHYNRGHQRGARGNQVARKDHGGRPRACSINNISMINVFTLTKSKLSITFIPEVCVKLVALRINRYTRSSSQFQKGWWPLHYGDAVQLVVSNFDLFSSSSSSEVTVPENIKTDLTAIMLKYKNCSSGTQHFRQTPKPHFSWAPPQLGLASFTTAEATARNGEHMMALQGYRNSKLCGCKYGASVLWGNKGGLRTEIPFHAPCTYKGWDHSNQRQQTHPFSLGRAIRGTAESGQTCPPIYIVDQLPQLPTIIELDTLPSLE